MECTVASLEPWSGDIAAVTNYYELDAAGAPEAASLVSKDRNSLVMPVAPGFFWASSNSAKGLPVAFTFTPRTLSSC